jgi:serine/threonine protein kinase
MALHPGLVLSHRYRLTRRIAVGGMGEVWAATDRTLGRDIAVKILKSELTSDPEFVGRFRTEAQITASLNNPGIAAVYDYGETASHPDGPQDTAFLVMELVSGEPLSAVLARTPRIPLDRVLDVLEQSGRALQEAHARGLVHRDIKPGNILITPTGQVKITDFGIAKVASQVPVTRGGMVMGTAQYLSPEQAAGDDARPASDVYALGIVGYECLAGFRPFVGDNPVIVAMAQIRNEPPPLPPDIPPAVVELIRHAMLKDPNQRYPDGEAFAAAVAAVRAGYAPPTGGFALPRTQALPPTQVFRAPHPRAAAVAPGPRPMPAAVPPGPPVARPRPKRHTALSVLIALLILALAGAAGTAMYFQTAARAGSAVSPPIEGSGLDGLRESTIVFHSEGWS